MRRCQRGLVCFRSIKYFGTECQPNPTENRDSLRRKAVLQHDSFACNIDLSIPRASHSILDSAKANLLLSIAIVFFM